MSVQNNANGPVRKEHGMYWKYLLCSVITTIALTVCVALYFMFNVDFSFVSSAACQQVVATKFTKEFTFCFYGSDWDEGTYLSSITSFYSTLVTVLIAVQALLATFAFVVIKASNKRVVEEEVESELPKYFETVAAERKIQSFVDDSVKTAIRNRFSDEENAIAGLQGDIEELRVRVTELEENGDIEIEETDNATRL